MKKACQLKELEAIKDKEKVKCRSCNSCGWYVNENYLEYIRSRREEIQNKIKTGLFI